MRVQARQTGDSDEAQNPINICALYCIKTTSRQSLAALAFFLHLCITMQMVLTCQIIATPETVVRWHHPLTTHVLRRGLLTSNAAILYDRLSILERGDYLLGKQAEMIPWIYPLSKTNIEQQLPLKVMMKRESHS